MPIQYPPVVGDAAHAVAHGVGVLDQDERPHGALGRPALRVVLEPVGTHIHRRDDVHILSFAGTLVEDRPGGIGAADPVRRPVEGLAVPGFVAERPDDHRRVVAVALHHADGAVEVRLEPVRPSGQRDAGLVSHAVGLDVRFVHHIEPVLVREFVEPGQVRVVRGADGVDVQRLHQAQVFPHRGFVHHMAALRVVLVAVHAPDGERPPVEQQPGVPDLDPPEPDADRYGFGRAAGRIAQRQREPVERRGLGGPGAHRPEVPLQRRLGLSAGFDLGFERPRRSRDRAAFGIEEFHQQVVRPRRFRRRVLEERREREAAVPVGVVQVGGDFEVPEIGARPRQQAHAPVDSADAPEVLALQVTPVAPAYDLDGDQVRAGAECVRDAELRRGAASLAVSDLPAVDEHEEGGIDAFEAEEDFVAGPLFRQVEGAPVGADRVLVLRNARRVGGEGIGLVPVHRVSVALEFPIRRHGNRVPPGVVVVGLEETRGPFGRIPRPVELPVAVQDEHAAGVLGAPRQGRLRRRERRETRPRRFPVPREDGRVLPRRRLLSRLGGSEGRPEQEDRRRPPGAGERGRHGSISGSGASGGARWPASRNAMMPNSAPHEWKGSLESRSSSPVPVIEE